VTIKDIEERSGVPFIVGTRISVDDVFTYLLEPSMTEATIGHLLSLTVEQVASARAYILTNPGTVLARHLEIEAKSDAAVNPPEVVERMRRTHQTLLDFKDWLERREATEARESAENGAGSGHLPSFREWLAERE
jgi:uncharacterized protein (DUF433 family)